MKSKKTLFYIIAPAILLILIIIGSNDSARDSFSRIKVKKTATSSNSFNKSRLSIDDPASLWVVVNKTRPLSPTNYAPNDLVIPNVPLRFSTDYEEMQLRKPAADSLEKMVLDAKEEGINLLLASGYRSYDLQTTVYNNFVGNQGRETADTQSARPGYSEHQTGLAVDLGRTDRSCEIEDCFASTNESKWLAANSYKYGFIVRYQPDTKAVAGYQYEPWHFRYVGPELATQLKNQNNPTLEEFFSLPAAPDYN